MLRVNPYIPYLILITARSSIIQLETLPACPRVLNNTRFRTPVGTRDMLRYYCPYIWCVIGEIPALGGMRVRYRYHTQVDYTSCLVQKNPAVQRHRINGDARQWNKRVFVPLRRRFLSNVLMQRRSFCGSSWHHAWSLIFEILCLPSGAPLMQLRNFLPCGLRRVGVSSPYFTSSGTFHCFSCNSINMVDEFEFYLYGRRWRLF
jgi:hypothetical protein